MMIPYGVVFYDINYLSMLTVPWKKKFTMTLIGNTILYTLKWLATWTVQNFVAKYGDYNNEKQQN